MPSLTRADLQALSRVRLREAAALLQMGHYDGAYYLCGYAVECALKACIARATRRFEFPDRNRANQSWGHNLESLFTVAQLKAQLDQDRRLDLQLDANWTTVKEWSVDSRYQRYTEQQARAIYAAASDRQHGVLRWLSRYW